MSLLRATAAVDDVKVLGVAGNCSFKVDDDGLANHIRIQLYTNAVSRHNEDTFTVSNISDSNGVISFTFKSVDTLQIENIDVEGIILANLRKYAESYDKTKGKIGKHISDLELSDVVFRMSISMVGTARALDYDTKSLEDILAKYQRVNNTNIDVEDISESNDSVTVTVSDTDSYKDAKSSVLTFLRDATRNRPGGTERMRFTPNFDQSMRSFVEKPNRSSRSMSWLENMDSFTKNIAKENKRALTLMSWIRNLETVGDNVTELYRKLANMTYVYQLGLSSEAKMVNEMVDNILFGNTEDTPAPESAEKLRTFYNKYKNELDEAEKVFQSDPRTSNGRNAHLLETARRNFNAAMKYIREKATEIYDPVVPRSHYLSAQMRRAIKNDENEKNKPIDGSKDAPLHSKYSDAQVQGQAKAIQEARSRYDAELDKFIKQNQGIIDDIKEDHARKYPDYDPKDFDVTSDPRYPDNQVYSGSDAKYLVALMDILGVKDRYTPGQLTWKEAGELLGAYQKKVDRLESNYKQEDLSVFKPKNLSTNFSGDARLLKAIQNSTRTDAVTKTSHLSPEVREAVVNIVRENAGTETAQKLDTSFDSVMSTGDNITSNFLRNKRYDAKVYDDVVSFMSQILNAQQGALPPVVNNFFKTHTKSMSEAIQEKQQWINAIREKRSELFSKYHDKPTDEYGMPIVDGKANSVFTDPVNSINVKVSDKLFIEQSDNWIATLSESIESDLQKLRGKEPKKKPGLRSGKGEGVAEHNEEATKEAANATHIKNVSSFIKKYENIKELSPDKLDAFEEEYLDIYSNDISVLRTVKVKEDLCNQAADTYDRLMGNTTPEYSETVDVQDNPSEAAPSVEPIDKGVAQEAINSTQTPAEGN